MTLLDIFINTLLPVLLLAGAGFILGRTLNLNPRPIGRVIFYIFSPILVFDLITQSQLLPKSIFLMGCFSICTMLLVTGLAYIISKLFHLDRPILMAVVLTSLIGNNGNYGLPVISFAFGVESLAYASIYFVTSNIMVYTLGAFIASLGQMKVRYALLALLKVPAIYAIVLAMIFVVNNWALPIPIQRTVDLASGAAIPCMLILLGMQLKNVEWRNNKQALGIPVVLRLLITPLIALMLSSIFSLPRTAQKAGIIEAGMPSGVMTTVLATEYNLEPSLVTAIVFITTIISPLTLTPLLYLLLK